MMDIISLTQRTIAATGGRMTTQRKLILNVLSQAKDHPSAEEIHNILAQNLTPIHISTIYRTLRWLEKEGIVRSHVFNTEDRSERFDIRQHIHHHFLCSTCGAVIEFDSEFTQQNIDAFASQNNAVIESGSMVLHGICENCLQENAE